MSFPLIAGAGQNWLGNIEDFHDPTGGLPVPSVVGEQYIATATANGWTENYLYSWNGATWDETVPASGDRVYDKATGTVWIFDSTAWDELSALSFPVVFTKGAIFPLGPSDGDVHYYTTESEYYVYDGGRSKWLSMNVDEFLYGRDGNAVSGALLNTAGAVAGHYSRISVVSVITEIRVAQTISNNAQFPIEIYDNEVLIGTVNVPADTLSFSASLNIDVPALAADEYGLEVRYGTIPNPRPSDCNVILQIQKRGS